MERKPFIPSNNTLFLPLDVTRLILEFFTLEELAQIAHKTPFGHDLLLRCIGTYHLKQVLAIGFSYDALKKITNHQNEYVVFFPNKSKLNIYKLGYYLCALLAIGIASTINYYIITTSPDILPKIVFGAIVSAAGVSIALSSCIAGCEINDHHMTDPAIALKDNYTFSFLNPQGKTINQLQQEIFALRDQYKSLPAILHKEEV